MPASTIAPAVLSNAQPAPSIDPTSICLETLDESTPLATLRQVAECIIISLELGSPVWENIVPVPRAPLDVQIDRAALQHRLALRGNGKVYVRAVGTVGGEERTLGVAIWQRPGVRYHSLTKGDMSSEEGEAYEGYDLVFRDAFFGGFQSYRDRFMGDDLYWYLSILVVHPDAQKLKIGSRLLDHGLQNLVESRFPTILEATPAGERLYTSRGFNKEFEFAVAEQYPGMGEMKFPLYRRPAGT
ncbi:hypothetical protein NCC49_004465 [Naganishia albida]|nr:hypothetical protein NCC49_004465 [Naganishia albida]